MSVLKTTMIAIALIAVFASALICYTCVAINKDEEEMELNYRKEDVNDNSDA